MLFIGIGLQTHPRTAKMPRKNAPQVRVPRAPHLPKTALWVPIAKLGFAMLFIGIGTGSPTHRKNAPQKMPRKNAPHVRVSRAPHFLNTALWVPTAKLCSTMLFIGIGLQAHPRSETYRVSLRYGHTLTCYISTHCTYYTLVCMIVH